MRKCRDAERETARVVLPQPRYRIYILKTPGTAYLFPYRKIIRQFCRHLWFFYLPARIICAEMMYPEACMSGSDLPARAPSLNNSF
jgi:hypothetical protein